MRQFKRSFFLVFIVSLLCGMSGCQHTAHGFGKDVQESGRAIESATR